MRTKKKENKQMKMILEIENKEDEKRVQRVYRLLQLNEIEISDKRNTIKNILKSIEPKRKRVKKISIPSREERNARFLNEVF